MENNKSLRIRMILWGCLIFFSVTARAETNEFALSNTLKTRLAYVITGTEEIDTISRLGLSSLNFILHQRTAAELGPPQAIDLKKHDLSFFPLIYWPIAEGFKHDYTSVQPKILKYLKNGGTILFDTKDHHYAGLGGSSLLKKMAIGFQLPNLKLIPEDHALGRSFYLLKTFPGRWEGGQVWVEQADARLRDGVSSIVVGGHDWAGAWAVDRLGVPLLPVVPGGERQREMAYRFGVNLVMYTLTGNYKKDQVHLPSILERLGR